MGEDGGRMDCMVRPNSLTPDTDVTNLAQTKTPTTPNPNDARLMTTIWPNNDNDDESAKRQKLKPNKGERAATVRGPEKAS